MVDQLLAPRRRDTEQDLDAPEDTLELIPAIELRFSPEICEAVDRWMTQEGTLGEFLEASRKAGEPPAVRRLLVLKLLWAWDPDGREPLSVRAAGRLSDPEYVGQDLHLGGEE